MLHLHIKTAGQPLPPQTTEVRSLDVESSDFPNGVLKVNGPLVVLTDGLISVLERALALAILVAAAPVMLLIAIVIRLDSPGRAIFTQQRIARFNRSFPKTRNVSVPTFTLYKFRTYYDRSASLAPSRAAFEFDPETIDHIQLQLADDPRITRVGRFLRRTSLDELPNFINVLKGEMRLIGPRPEVQEMYRYYSAEQREKFSVKPGITGLAQVNGRGKLNFKQTVTFDLWYVRHRSWLLDLYILLKTFKVVLTGDGSF
jgi:lipopolysaccharide/colanic/teichoic acid biosynthesis glycosyltransferase